jgi:citrate synthase
MAEMPDLRLDLTTEISSYDLHHIWIRGLDLTSEVMGELSFTDVVFLLVAGRLPSSGDRALLDAVLIALMEHGLTASAVAARFTYWAAPEAIQGAVAAGLLGAGSKVLGSMEECGQILTRIDALVSSGRDRSEVIEEIVREYREQGRHLPGIGHAVHTEGDPRADRLYEIAEECGRRGRHLDAMQELHRVAEERIGRRMPLNVTGAISAILMELEVPWQLHRGFALISRTVGLVGHIGEELSSPITPVIRRGLFTASSHGHPSAREDGD